MSLALTETINTFATLDPALREAIQRAWAAAGIEVLSQNPEEARRIMRRMIANARASQRAALAAPAEPSTSIPTVFPQMPPAESEEPRDVPGPERHTTPATPATEPPEETPCSDADGCRSGSTDAAAAATTAAPAPTPTAAPEPDPGALF